MDCRTVLYGRQGDFLADRQTSWAWRGKGAFSPVLAASRLRDRGETRRPVEPVGRQHRRGHLPVDAEQDGRPGSQGSFPCLHVCGASTAGTQPGRPGSGVGSHAKRCPEGDEEVPAEPVARRNVEVAAALWLHPRRDGQSRQGASSSRAQNRRAGGACLHRLVAGQEGHPRSAYPATGIDSWGRRPACPSSWACGPPVAHGPVPSTPPDDAVPTPAPAAGVARGCRSA